MSKEKRRHVRWKKKLKLSYALTEEMEFYTDIFTEDISEEGLGIFIPDPIELHETVRLKIEFINDSVPLYMSGRVVFLKKDEKKYRIGMVFIDMDAFQKRRIKQNIEAVNLSFEDRDSDGTV